MSSAERIAHHDSVFGLARASLASIKPAQLAVFLHCYMDDHIRPEGWTKMHGVDPRQERLFEYGSSGPGAHPNRPQLSAQEATLYAPIHVLANWTLWEESP